MTLCHPGAHGLLLVVSLSFSFSAKQRHVVEEHVDLFGPRAWRHTLVLFTVMDKDCLCESTLQDEVELNSELQKLVEKCGGRYHTLQRRPKRGEDQVAELMKKIYEMAFSDGESMLISDQVLEWSREREEEQRREEEEERKKRQVELTALQRQLFSLGLLPDGPGNCSCGAPCQTPHGSSGKPHSVLGESSERLHRLLVHFSRQVLTSQLVEAANRLNALHCSYLDLFINQQEEMKEMIVETLSTMKEQLLEDAANLEFTG
ncbi:Dual serine/threonine and tyrosine protein kinase [Bagarius yarrelli]|uniref:Dual serine/threonine and tyrosine protein kinase n=1 Tax=Bagarius yarrelli TaxID=175774 RepID=A0A556VVB0_BAGYA|nr:Dual serine/threonine and tyrosine protein kinase [Bagarius yarrelli]